MVNLTSSLPGGTAVKYHALATAFAFFCLASPVHGQTASPAERFQNAVTWLDSRFGPEDEYRAPPAVDADAAEKFQDLVSSMEVYGSEDFPASEQSYLSVCVPLTKLTARYANAGAAAIPGIRENTPAASAQLSHLQDRNVLAYQDETTILTALDVVCMALHTQVFTEDWEAMSAATRSTFAADIRGMQHGAMVMLDGLAIIADNQAISRHNQDIAVAALSGYADVYASILTVPDRKALLAAIRKNAPGLAKQYPAQFAAISKAFARTDCAGLCTVR